MAFPRQQLACSAQQMRPLHQFTCISTAGQRVPDWWRSRSLSKESGAPGSAWGHPSSSCRRDAVCLMAFLLAVGDAASSRASRSSSSSSRPLQRSAATRSLRRWRLFLACSILMSVGLLWPSAAGAAEAVTPDKLHLGQRIALGLREMTGCPDWLILIMVSAMPAIELRGGIPVGLWMGLPVPYVMALCILGNMLFIPVFMLALRYKAVTRLFAPLLKRAKKKTSAVSEKDRWSGLAAFVGVPLPGTGAWTGVMVAFLLGMDFLPATTAILAGVSAAACIMTGLTWAGWYGCAIAVVVCTVALGSRYIRMLFRR